jgi:hypothetical protein
LLKIRSPLPFPFRYTHATIKPASGPNAGTVEADKKNFMLRLPGRFAAISLLILILLVPLLLTRAWGINLAGDAYLLLQYAKSLTGGSGTILAAAAEGAVARSPSMLFTLMVSALALLGIEHAAAAAFLSALGWSAAAFALLAVGKVINHQPGSAFSALLLCFNPIIISTSGTPVSWVVALAWWVAAFLLSRRYFLMLAALLLLALMLLPLPPAFPVLQTMLAEAFAWSLLLFLGGLGAEFAARWLAANIDTQSRSQTVYTLALAVIFLFAGVFQLSRLNERFQTRPQALWALEEDVARWLETNTAANAVVGTSERAGYLANRRTIPVQALAASQTAQALQEQLEARPPDYLVSSAAMPWQLLANSRWFRLNYQPLAEFENPYTAGVPYTIWGYQPPPPDLGPAYALNARVPNRLSILGYQLDQADFLSTGEALLTLYLEAAADTIESAKEFSLKTRLLSPEDGSTLAEWDVVLPTSANLEAWPDGRIREQIQISDLPDLEPGAYPINISLVGPESPEFWPISLDNDLERLDRLPVGYLVVPTAVNEAMIQAQEATFADQIKLLGYTTSDPRPGEGLALTLYWQASELLGDGVPSLNVFTHVLDGSGQLVAGHDSIPGNGRYPTPSWLPGMTIADPHVIQLPPDLPSGAYEIWVGLYDPENGERLAVVAADGLISPDNAFPLTRFSLP